MSSHQEKSVSILHTRHERDSSWQTWSLPPLSCCSVVDLSLTQVIPVVDSTSHDDVISVGGKNRDFFGVSQFLDMDCRKVCEKK